MVDDWFEEKEIEEVYDEEEEDEFNEDFDPSYWGLDDEDD